MTHRKGHPQSRPLPAAIEPELPPHLRDIALTAMIGTVNAPIGASMPAIFLASAKALIDKALRMQRGELASDFMKADGR